MAVGTKLDSFVVNGTIYEILDKTAQRRIDEIIKKDTPTVNNTEIVDIRTGQNGTTYDTAGTAVREQIREVKEGLPRLIEPFENRVKSLEKLVDFVPYNLFNPYYSGLETSVSTSYKNGLLKNYSIHETTGQLTQVDGKATTYPIEIDGAKTIYTKAGNNQEIEVICEQFFSYDKDMLFLTKSNKNTREFTVPSNAKFIRMVISDTPDAKLNNAIENKITICYDASSNTPYQAYFNRYRGIEDKRLREDLKQLKATIDNVKYKDLNSRVDRFKKELPKIFKPFEYPDGFETTYSPVTIYYDGSNFKTNFNRELVAYKSVKTFYVSKDGVGDNLGLEEDKPTTLSSALKNVSDGDTIIIKEGMYLQSDLTNEPLDFAKNINIIGLGEVILVFGGSKVVFNLDLSNKIYNAPKKQPNRVITTDLEVELIRAESLSACKKTLFSYFEDNESIYVNTPFDPSGNILLLNKANGLDIINKKDCKLYLENLTLVGGNSTTKTIKAPNTKLEVIYNNIKTLYNTGSDSHDNTMYFTGGNILLNNCVAMYSYNHGIAYQHNLAQDDILNFVEISCICANNGSNGVDRSSGSVNKTKSKGIRINSFYYNNYGESCMIDGENVLTLHLGCECNEGSNTNFAESFTIRQAGTKAWYYNCISNLENHKDLAAYSDTIAFTKKCKFTNKLQRGQVTEI